MFNGMSQYINKIFFERSTLFKMRIIGILMINIGIIFFINPIIESYNLSVTFILIGIFIFFFPSKYVNYNNKDAFVIGLILTWNILILLITINSNLEMLFVLNFLGILVINEITDKISSKSLKLRLNISVFLFFFLFIVIVITNIINI